MAGFNETDAKLLPLVLLALIAMVLIWSYNDSARFANKLALREKRLKRILENTRPSYQVVDVLSRTFPGGPSMEAEVNGDVPAGQKWICAMGGCQTSENGIFNSQKECTEGCEVGSLYGSFTPEKYTFG